MLITEEQKLDAWRWLCREALAGNTNAVTVLVDWASPPEKDQEDDPLDRIAVTFQWWIDEYDRGPERPGVGITPPVLPLVRAIEEWISYIQEAAVAARGTKYADNLRQVARCLQLLCRHSLGGVEVNPPAWPSRATLKDWIRVLKAPPPPRGPEC